MDIINKIEAEILYPLIGLLFAVAVAFFAWGIIDYIFNADSEDKRATGKRHIIWGLVGLFIMSAVVGIIQLIKNLVNF
jgi:hypothetical protein